MRRLSTLVLLLLAALPLLADNAVTEHAATIGGKSFRYAAEAGHLNVRTGPKEPEAQIFFVAYTALPRDPNRPVTFLFNGGPGSSSIWLHMGAFGPKRVPLDANGMPRHTGSARAVANEESILDLTDLIFIDPVGTGLSKANPAEDAAKFHEVRADGEITVEFIRAYLAREKRHDAPVYIAGESYGTIRASLVADGLQRRFGIPITGVMLISPAVNTQVYRYVLGNDLPYSIGFPALAMTAWYHKRAASDLQALPFDDFRRRSEAFAKETLVRVLFEGSALPDEEKKRIAGEMSRFLGIGADEILRRNLRVGNFDYAELLLRDQQKTVGVLDGRYTGLPNSAPPVMVAGDYTYGYYDASIAVDSVFASAFRDYLANELKFASTANYEILSLPTAAGWNWDAAKNRFLYAGDTLRAAMTMHPSMKLFVGNGYYDLVTPHLGAEYQIHHLGLPAELLRKNVTMKFYPSGHMMYVHDESMKAMKRDLAEWYR
ncbi:MAG TPA: peptidase S10 [Thermoanaerobaculia bacterium]